ncbi:MAG: hypothetical protein KDJ50_05965 [Alphaproteobacteria bacterium]|nr:hypothetical protein [Alphaproteobacteria bacterium]
MDKEEKPSILRQMLASLLSPLVHLLVSNGISYREFNEVSREVFFKKSYELLERQGKKVTSSHLSLISGLHRKETTEFLRLMKSEGGSPHLSNAETKPESPYSAMVAEWISNSRYTDKDGVPLELPYSIQHDGSPSFFELTESITKDMRPNVFMTEMIRLGIIVPVGADQQTLRLEKAAFLPSTDFKEKMTLFSRNVGDHLKASVVNMESEAPPFFERSAFYSDLSEEDVLIIKSLIQKDGMEFLKKIYRTSDDLASKHEAGSKRINCGIYFYAENCHDNNDS